MAPDLKQSGRESVISVRMGRCHFSRLSAVPRRFATILNPHPGNSDSLATCSLNSPPRESYFDVIQPLSAWKISDDSRPIYKYVRSIEIGASRVERFTMLRSKLRKLELTLLAQPWITINLIQAKTFRICSIGWPSPTHLRTMYVSSSFAREELRHLANTKQETNPESCDKKFHGLPENSTSMRSPDGDRTVHKIFMKLQELQSRVCSRL